VRKVTLLLLGGAWLLAGCANLQDDYYDPYTTSYEFGYSYGSSVYQLPFAYYQRCYGIYRSCLFYRPPYVPVPGAAPDEDGVIQPTHPPVMANGDALIFWRGLEPRGSDANAALDGPAIANDWREPRPTVRGSEPRSGPARLRPANRPVSRDRSPRTFEPARAPARVSTGTRSSSAVPTGRSARPAAPRSAPRAVRRSAPGPRTPSSQPEP
jgi:hypothetical protein